ncbi:MAG: hypothetical protein FWB88_00240 [Defluviitaleaceae bacterium]|nr:hypothetical protein [Defluviitaleaceae bacterium]MCL2239105.1 hypothetical protein [Defluviitaleaceae bacterium]
MEDTARYVKINDIEGSELLRIWDEFKAKHAGFECNLCFHNMEPPYDALEKIGATLLEDCIGMGLTPENFKPFRQVEVALLDKKDFAAFAKLHDQLPDMYWTSSRIWDRFDDMWRIPVYKEQSELAGYALMNISMHKRNEGEIFAIQAPTPQARKALLTAAVEEAFKAEKDHILHMVERGNDIEYEESEAIGFIEVSYYRGFEIKEL